MERIHIPRRLCYDEKITIDCEAEDGDGVYFKSTPNAFG